MKIFTLVFLCGLSLLVSAQSGITWNMGMNISTNTYDNLHPRVAVNASGNPLVIWGRMSDESVFFSRWNGTMFTAPVKLNGTLTVATASWMGPDIASHGDTIYIVFKETPEADTASHIYIVRSFDGGMSFSSAMQVDFIGDSISRFPTVTTDDVGNPIVGFMKFDPTFGDARWVVTKSSDYGSTFSPDVKASGWSSATSTVCDCCPGGIVGEGSTIAMLYRDNNSNIRDSWLGLSINGGSTFSNGWNIDQNNWMIMACPSTGPDGVIVGDSLYSVFTNGSGGMRVYQSVSSISGMSAPPSQMLAGSIPGLTSQNYPRIDRYGNAMAIVWKQFVSGIEQLPILFTNDYNNGFPAQYDTVDLGNIMNTDVALSNGNIFVVWQDDNSGTVRYRSGTFSIPTDVEEKDRHNLFSVSPNPVADGMLTIQRTNVKDSQIEYSITNLLGQELIHQVAAFQNSSLQVDISGLSTGTYFLKIVTDSEQFVSKIVRQ